MSYILDALKKSERQRPPGPVPDLFSIQGPEPPPPRRLPARAIAVALLAGCVVVLAVWASLESRGSRGDAPQAAAGESRLAAQATATATEPAPGTEPAPETVLEPAPQPPSLPVPALAPEPAPQKTDAVRAAMPETAPEPGGRPPEVPAAAAPSPMPPAPSAAPSTQRAASPEPVPDASTPLPDSATPQAPAPSPAAEAPAPAPPPAPVAPVELPDPLPPGDRVVELAELPPAIRQKLPELVISGHVWSDEAGLRLLTLKDRVVREGGEAAPGVQLERITQSGAVFVFRGWRFSVAAF